MIEARRRFDPWASLPGGFSLTDGTIAFYDQVKSLLPETGTVLDLGAGRGAWFEDDPVPVRRAARDLRRSGLKIIGADVDPAVHDNRTTDENLLIEDGRVPLPDGSCDLVVSDFVLEHIEDEAAFAREVDRLLKPGGWFCARTPHRFNYVSIAARLVSNAKHAPLIGRVQPGRKEHDVFPTVYRLNSGKAIRSAFVGYDCRIFIYRSDPSYFFGSRLAFAGQRLLQRIAPAAFVGSIFAFLQKPAPVPPDRSA